MKNRFLMVFRVGKKNMIFKIENFLRLVFCTLAPAAGTWSRHQVPWSRGPGARRRGPGARRGHQVPGPVENQCDSVMIEHSK